MRRRDLITLLGGAAAWPVATRAQQGVPMRRIGWLALPSKGSGPLASQLNAFKRAVADLGWIEGRNLEFEERWADNDAERLHQLAAQLVAARRAAVRATGEHGRRRASSVPPAAASSATLQITSLS